MHLAELVVRQGLVGGLLNRPVEVAYEHKAIQTSTNKVFGEFVGVLDVADESVHGGDRGRANTRNNKTRCQYICPLRLRGKFGVFG